MCSRYPEDLVTTGLVQDGKYDRDGVEGKDLGSESRCCEHKDMGVVTTEAQ